MEKKQFELGIIVGRFQTFHVGHQQMIETAEALCERVCVFVGSSQEYGTFKNPYPYEVREMVLRRIFPDTERIHIYPLPDSGVGNTSLWGDYVLDNVALRFGRLPDLLLTGKEERRTGWFASEKGMSIAELFIPKTIHISASEMRDFLIRDDRETWERYSDPRIHDLYPMLREYVMKAKDVLETQSV